MEEETNKAVRVRQGIILACLVLAVLIVIVWTQMSLSGREKENLSAMVTEMKTISKERTFPNPATVKAWESYRNDLDAEFQGFENFLRERDVKLDA
jgi:hypothetical protein